MKKQHTERKSSRQVRWDRAILALQQHTTLEHAAEAVGINPSTLHRWMRIPEFLEKLKAASHEVYKQAMRGLQQATTTAVNTLIGTLNDPKAPARTRARTARQVIESSRKRVSSDQRQERLAELEAECEFGKDGMPDFRREGVGAFPEPVVREMCESMRATVAFTKAKFAAAGAVYSLSCLSRAKEGEAKPTTFQLGRWDRAIMALLQHSTREDAAKAARVNPATLYRWMQIPEFQERLQTAEQVAQEPALGRLLLATHVAVDTLRRIMDDPEAPLSTRAQIAEYTIHRYQKDLIDPLIEKRVAKLNAAKSAENGTTLKPFVRDPEVAKLSHQDVDDVYKAHKDLVRYLKAKIAATKAGKPEEVRPPVLPLISLPPAPEAKQNTITIVEAPEADQPPPTPEPQAPVLEDRVSTQAEKLRESRLRARWDTFPEIQAPEPPKACRINHWPTPDRPYAG